MDLDAVRGFAAGVARYLRSGSRLLVQLLNYEAIVAEGRRTFPVSVRPASDGEGELVFLRFMDHPETGFVDFESVVLERSADETRLVFQRRSRLRAWTLAELRPAFEAA